MKNKRKERWPSVSFIVCTYNCRDNAIRCFSSIKKQEYDGKVEMLALDGGSSDGTIDVLKKIGVRVIHNPAQYPEGKGRGKWLGYRKAKGEIVIFIDSDNKLVEKNWIKQMINPLLKDKTVNFSICRMLVNKEDKMINRYLSLIGTDPVAAYKSIDSLLALKKLKLIDKGDYYIYDITTKNFIITGGYYFTIRKKTLDKIGGYTQDTDVVYNLAKNNMARVAIPKRAHVHHLISNSIINFMKKKFWWANVYFKTQIHNREFKWIPDNKKEKIKLIKVILKNIFFIPETITGIKMALENRESAWVLHPIMSWLTTIAYLSAYMNVKLRN